MRRNRSEVLLDAAIAVRRVAARFGQRAAVFAHLFRGEVADEGVALPDEFSPARYSTSK
jgi:hypothetical protein